MVVWTYGVPPDPYALIRINNLMVITAISDIETLRQLGMVGKANYKSLTSWE